MHLASSGKFEGYLEICINRIIGILKFWVEMSQGNNSDKNILVTYRPIFSISPELLLIVKI